MKKHLSCTMLVLLLLALCLVSCGDQSGTVEGTVTRADNRQPVAGATVYVYLLEKFEQVTDMNTYRKGSVLHRMETDENGSFTFTVKANPYVVEVQMLGLDTDSTLTEVKRGQTITLDFSLDPLP